MSAIFGSLNISDSDRVFNATVGQRAIYEVAAAYIERVNAELNAAMSVFVDQTLSDYKLRYKLPGAGTLQRRGNDGRYGAVKAYGQWDVAFPLEDFGAQIAGNDVDMAYMSVAELDRHISTIVAQNVNTVRFEILKALFNSGQRTFIDPLWGSLLVEPLANGDSVVYPPVQGSASEATENHYLESGYATASISDTNNPYITIRNELEEHFGSVTGGSSLVVFINAAERPKTEALTDFDPVPFQYLRPGTGVNVPVNLPVNLPGAIIGVCDGTIVNQWNHIPSGYMLGLHLDSPKPLIHRVDPADTGLGEGLVLVPNRDIEFPFEASFWRHRFGIGAGNRLNGVVMELGTGGTYSIPAAFA